MTGEHDSEEGAMTDRWTDRLSDYLDDALSPSERRDLDAHLAECGPCGGVLADLRAIVADARALAAHDVRQGMDADLWPAIEARVRDLPVRAVPEVTRGAWSGHRFTVSLTQLAAACVAVFLLSASAVWFAHDWGRREHLARGAARGGLIAVVPATSAPAEAARNEIESLKRVLDERRDRLDPATLRTIEESLASVEAAVEQARLALEADPNDSYLVAHLEELADRQVDLLRRAVHLAGGAE
jgi:anti-sigma factor RsiW